MPASRILLAVGTTKNAFQQPIVSAWEGQYQPQMITWSQAISGFIPEREREIISQNQARKMPGSQSSSYKMGVTQSNLLAPTDHRAAAFFPTPVVNSVTCPRATPCPVCYNTPPEQVSRWPGRSWRIQEQPQPVNLSLPGECDPIQGQAEASEESRPTTSAYLPPVRIELEPINPPPVTVERASHGVVVGGLD